MESRTKIVATLGPASSDASMVADLLRAGVDVVRLNLSHGTLEHHLSVLSVVRQVAADLGRHTAVLADLPGPKVRAGGFPEGGALLRAGAAVRLVAGEGPSDHHTITVEYPTLLDDLRAGDRVVVGDGAITLLVDEVLSTGADATVVTGGLVQGRPGVHLPSERMRLTAPTDEDLELAVALADAGVDFLAVSFVRTAADLRTVRRVLDERGTPVRLVAKIETLAAVAHLSEVVAASDAVMVARGDLGIECPLEDVPHLQKRIIRTCVELGVPVITATQVMESMITAPSPTRAEVSDIANAVYDGTDALMLSAETAIGSDPVNVVATMARVAARAEIEVLGNAGSTPWLGRWSGEAGGSLEAEDRVTLALSEAAARVAVDVGAAAILCCTRSGRSARAMARCRPGATLIGLSPDPATLRSLSASWGMHVIAVDTYRTTDEMVWFAVERALHAALIRHGDVVVVLAGAPDQPDGFPTDVVRIVRVR